MKLEKRLYLKVYDTPNIPTDLGDLPRTLVVNSNYAFDIDGRHNFPIKDEEEPITLFAFEEEGTLGNKRRNILPKAEIEVLSEEHYQDPHSRLTRTRGEYRVISLYRKK